MTIPSMDLVKYLYNILAIGKTNDSVLNAITEEELETILIKCSTTLGHVYPNIPIEDEPLVICLAKKEVYWKMATATAPLYSLNIDGLSVAKSVRFDHYLSLIKEVENEYNSLSQDYNRVKITVSDIIVDKPYTFNTRRANYVLPTTILKVDKAATTTLDVSMTYNNLKIKDYQETVIYLSEEPIWDKYDEVISPLATKTLVMRDPRKTYFRLKDLKPNTHYYILAQVKLFNGLMSYTEIEGDTLD